VKTALKAKHQFFRAEVTKGIQRGKSGVDREKEIIHGFAVMSEGNVKDVRGWEIDKTTLEQVAAAGNAHPKGLKSRFGHPNMCSDALGTMLGRAKNFRVDGGVVRADLYIDPTSHSTPQGDIGKYVLDLAEKDPDAFGTSAVISKMTLEKRINPDNTPVKDEQGNELPELLRVEALSAVDAVDDPAANNGMFSSMFPESVRLSADMTKFLDVFLQNSDAVEKTIAFLNRYRANNDEDRQTQQEEGIMELTIEMLSKEHPELFASIKKLGADEFQASNKEAAQLATQQAVDAAVQAERTRCGSIVAKGNIKEYAGCGAVVQDAILSGQTVVDAEGKMKDHRLGILNTASAKPAGHTEEVKSAALVSTLSFDESCQRDWDDNTDDVRGAFESLAQYKSFKAAQNGGQARIFSGARSKA